MSPSTTDQAGTLLELPERFWARVDKTDTCWLWKPPLNPSGYGQSYVRGVRTKLAHRLAYMALVGPIPEGLTLDHLCRVRNCVNPEHLEPVTTAENILRGVGFSAINAAKTRCPRGHEFTPENTYVHPDGRRRCITCRDQHAREWGPQRFRLTSARRRRLIEFYGDGTQILYWQPTVTQDVWCAEGLREHGYLALGTGRYWLTVKGRDLARALIRGER